MGAIKLRKAKQADEGAIGALHVDSWHQTYRGIVPDQMLAELSVEARIRMWSDVLGDPKGDTAVFVAEDGDHLVGFGSCGRQRNGALADAGFGGEIGAIYVLRSHQNRGTGRLLITALAQALSGLGHEAASLWVLRENAPARAFYEALGGVIIGEKKDTLPGAVLEEVAYGWRDLPRLMHR